MALKAGDLKSIGCIQFSHWKMQKCSGPVEELPQMPGRQSVVVAPDNPVRDLLTSGMCWAAVPCLTALPALSSAVISIRECQFISHHTRGQALVLLPSQESTACIKSETLPPLEEGNRDKSEMSPHVQDISWLQEQG